MEEELVYRVRDWDKLFENNRTRELRRMEWVPVPNRMDTEPYTELLTGHANGAAHLGVWLALLMIASRCDPRGTLLRESRTFLRRSRTLMRDESRTLMRDESRTLMRDESRILMRDESRIEVRHTPQSLAVISHLPATLIEEAIERLLYVGWLEETTVESLIYNGVSDSTTETPSPQDGAGNQQESRTFMRDKSRTSRARDERNGTERNGTEERRSASVEAEPEPETPELPPLKISQSTKPKSRKPPPPACSFCHDMGVVTVEGEVRRCECPAGVAVSEAYVAACQRHQAKPASEPKPVEPALAIPKTPEQTEAERIAWVRESLVGFVRGSKAETWPPPDDAICQQVLAASNGASCALIGQTLLELHRKGKQPEISWAWFPEVVGAFLNPPKPKRAGEDSAILRQAAQG